MLWWLVGLWLLSPALVPIFWLLGMLPSSGRSEHSGPTDNTLGAITAFAEVAKPAASYRVRDLERARPDRPHPAPTNAR